MPAMEAEPCDEAVEQVESNEAEEGEDPPAADQDAKESRSLDASEDEPTVESPQLDEAEALAVAAEAVLDAEAEVVAAAGDEQLRSQSHEEAEEPAPTADEAEAQDCGSLAACENGAAVESAQLDQADAPSVTAEAAPDMEGEAAVEDEQSRSQSHEAAEEPAPTVDQPDAEGCGSLAVSAAAESPEMNKAALSRASAAVGLDIETAEVAPDVVAEATAEVGDQLWPDSHVSIEETEPAEADASGSPAPAMEGAKTEQAVTSAVSADASPEADVDAAVEVVEQRSQPEGVEAQASATDQAEACEDAASKAEAEEAEGGGQDRDAREGEGEGLAASEGGSGHDRDEAEGQPPAKRARSDEADVGPDKAGDGDVLEGVDSVGVLEEGSQTDQAATDTAEDTAEEVVEELSAPEASGAQEEALAGADDSADEPSGACDEAAVAEAVAAGQAEPRADAEGRADGPAASDDAPGAEACPCDEAQVAADAETMGDAPASHEAREEQAADDAGEATGDVSAAEDAVETQTEPRSPDGAEAAEVQAESPSACRDSPACSDGDGESPPPTKRPRVEAAVAAEEAPDEILGVAGEAASEADTEPAKRRESFGDDGASLAKRARVDVDGAEDCGQRAASLGA